MLQSEFSNMEFYYPYFIILKFYFIILMGICCKQQVFEWSKQFDWTSGSWVAVLILMLQHGREMADLVICFWKTLELFTFYF